MWLPSTNHCSVSLTSSSDPPPPLTWTPVSAALSSSASSLCCSPRVRVEWQALCNITQSQASSQVTWSDTTNQRPVFSIRDQTRPMRGQYLTCVSLLASHPSSSVSSREWSYLQILTNQKPVFDQSEASIYLILVSDVWEVHRVLPDHLILSEEQGRGQPQELGAQRLQTRGIRAKLGKYHIEDQENTLTKQGYL